jgi:hypothetical protein
MADPLKTFSSIFNFAIFSFLQDFPAILWRKNVVESDFHRLKLVLAGSDWI